MANDLIPNTSHSRWMPTVLAPLSVVLIFMIWLVPRWQVSQIPPVDSADLQQLPSTEQISVVLQEKYQRVELEEEFRNTIFLALFGCGGGLISYLLWQKVGTKSLQYNTEAFRQAIELLADKDKVEARLGGIYLLEHIAKTSKSHQVIILEVLTAFIRENSPKVGDERHLISSEINTLCIPTDIQSALTVIARSHLADEEITIELDFKDAYLIQANLLGANLQGANFQQTYLIGTNLRDANLADANLRSADLLSANLCNANLYNANLSSANLLGTNLNGTNFQEADLIGANLRGSYLGNANLSGANLNSADLIGVYLSDANLSQAKLIGANLHGAKLIGADLTQTDFCEANLTGADLSEAQLNGADFTDANLQEVSFKGADLKGSNLSGADLRDVHFLTANQLAECKLCQTKLPDDLALDGNRDCAATQVTSSPLSQADP